MDNKIEVLGFKAYIDSVDDILNRINELKKDGEVIQLLNADAIAGERHVLHGANHAILAFDRDENLANDLSVEIALRCSAQRQISKAFKILGLKKGEMNLCVVLINCGDYTSELSEIFDFDESVLEPNIEKLVKIYEISQNELENLSIENIIIDKITKLVVDY